MRPLRELTLDELRRRTSVKWRLFGPDVLPLWVAEMDVRLADPIRRQLQTLLDESDTGYPAGTEAYADAFADFALKRWAWRPGHSIATAGAMTGIELAIRLSTDYGAPVVINQPVYPPFVDVIRMAQRRVVVVPLLDSGRLDLDALDSTLGRLGPGAGYLLCSPHNPTSIVHTEDELAAVARIAERRDARVVVDEIHGPLAGTGFVPYLSLAGTDNAFAVTSASKSFNLAGIKAGLLLAGAASASGLCSLPDLAHHGASHFGVSAHTVAFRDCADWLDDLLVDVADNRQLLAGLLAEHLPGVRWNGEPGTYLAWLDFRDTLLGDDPAAVILERGKVALNSGLDFGHGGHGFARLNYATTPDILAEAVRGIAHAVASVR